MSFAKWIGRLELAVREWRMLVALLLLWSAVCMLGVLLGALRDI